MSHGGPYMTTSENSLSAFSDLLEDAETVPEPSPRRTRRTRIATISAITAVALILGLAGAYVMWALEAPPPAPTLTAHTPPAPELEATVIELPSSGAAAITVRGGRDFLGENGLQAAHGETEKRSIASITKLITALVVLDAYPIDGDGEGRRLTFDRADHALYDEYYLRGATIARMPAGSSMSLRDALSMLLVPSASNYADAVSTWAFGSRSGFVAATRAWLAEHGLGDTTIVEPTGLDPDNTSTPRDLLALAEIAAADPVIASIAAMESISLPAPGLMYSTNGLLGIEGITGLKTGNLGRDFYNLLYTASVDVGTGEPLEVTGVVLGGYSRDTVDSSVLETIRSIRAGFRTVPVAEPGDRVGVAETAWGASTPLVVSEPASVFVWSDTAVSASIAVTDAARVGDTAGAPAGTVTWEAGPRTATAPVTLEGDLEPPSTWWRLTHPFELLEAQ